MFDLSIPALNERADKLGYSVALEDPPVLPISDANDAFRFNMGQGEWCRVLVNGEPVFKFSWRAEEVSTWLRFRERAAREWLEAA